MKQKVEKEIYFVRHGQSVDNVSPVFQSVNSPLSEAGQNQAQSIANRLSKVEFETLIASPVKRAALTAQYISRKTGKKVEFSELFVERIKPDGIGGKPYTDEPANKLWRAWEASCYTPGVRIGDGEGYDELVKRADEALDFLLNRPEASLAIVTHGYFLTILLARVLLGDNLTGETLKRVRERVSIENTSITVLKYSNAFEQDFTWRLWTLNDHSHFAD